MTNLSIKRIKAQYFLKQQEMGFSETQLIYFIKIIQYCKEKKKSLVILNTPMHKNYKEKVPIKFKNKFYQIINANNLKLIEFDNLTINDTDFLPDGDHVTESGAVLVTEYLKKSLIPKDKG